MSKKLNLSFRGKSELLYKMSKDFYKTIKAGGEVFPEHTHYVINDNEEDPSIEQSARIKSLATSLEKKSITKLAFDTRRIDQETQRMPRQNLQYWRRSDAFIDAPTQDKINKFSSLFGVLKEIKSDFGTTQEYHESYSRILHDNVERLLRLDVKDNDIASPQLSYLEQILFARYRLSMDDLTKYSSSDLRNKILEKDENLLKRGAFLEKSKGLEKTNNLNNPNVINAGFGINGMPYMPQVIYANQPAPQIIIDSSKITEQTKDGVSKAIGEIIEASSFRKPGERLVERTITINIRDEVKE